MTAHIPVLLSEVLDALSPREGSTALDCTCGLGGHAEALAERLGPSGTLVLNDLDPANLRAACERIEGMSRGPMVIGLEGNFAGAPRKLVERGLCADVVLADLGVASPHLDRPERGFSFGRDGPLDMRFSPSQPTTAADLVNHVDEQELASIIHLYGEEPRARAVARRIVERRMQSPFETTAELAEVIRSVVPRHGKIDPATKVFQAIRIAVNDEIGSLEAFLEHIERAGRMGGGREGVWFASGARIGIISFHSLEDRAVKNAFKRIGDQGTGTPSKLIRPDEVEIRRNPRSRSSRLRVLEMR